MIRHPGHVNCPPIHLLPHSHEVAFSLPSTTAQNRLSLPKLLPWRSLFALDDPVTVINTSARNAG